jgi:hypothetical protein
MRPRYRSKRGNRSERHSGPTRHKRQDGQDNGRGTLISHVPAFIVCSAEATDPEAHERFPEQPFDSDRLAAAFKRFPLPDRLH